MGSTAAPQPAVAGKVIQPQPRGAAEMASGRKDSGVKPAWGNARVPSVVGRPDLTQSDFPTAAEVAQGLLLLVFLEAHEQL